MKQLMPNLATPVTRTMIGGPSRYNRSEILSSALFSKDDFRLVNEHSKKWCDAGCSGMQRWEENQYLGGKECHDQCYWNTDKWKEYVHRKHKGRRFGNILALNGVPAPREIVEVPPQLKRERAQAAKAAARKARKARLASCMNLVKQGKAYVMNYGFLGPMCRSNDGKVFISLLR